MLEKMTVAFGWSKEVQEKELCTIYSVYSTNVY